MQPDVAGRHLPCQCRASPTYPSVDPVLSRVSRVGKSASMGTMPELKLCWRNIWQPATLYLSAAQAPFCFPRAPVSTQGVPQARGSFLGRGCAITYHMSEI